MAKLAIYNGEAERLFVQEGMNLDAILGQLGNKISRKTLYNWKIAGEWERKREDYVKETRDIRQETIDIVRATIVNAKANPTPKNILAFARAIAALKAYDGVKLLEDETTPQERKELTGDIVSKIEKDLGIV